ncbi:MAG: hypothetical protein LBI56_02905 [Puniceicoccales bacterium]|nr:hypothetical protein [Puniceicoccales bacterium]
MFRLKSRIKNKIKIRLVLETHKYFAMACPSIAYSERFFNDFTGKWKSESKISLL